MIAMNTPDLTEPNEVQDIETIRKLFVDNVQFKHFVDGQSPARRAAFITMHGGAYGTFKINPHIDKRCITGIFQPGAEYKAWVRFSSDVPYSKPERKSTVGIGIKLFNVPGTNILDMESWPGIDVAAGSQATNVDFTLQNHPVFFASDAAQMAAFKTAAVNGQLDAFMEIPENHKLRDILKAMEHDINSVFETEYWSCIPFKLGTEGIYCKYILSPLEVPAAVDVDPAQTHFFKEDLQKRLLNEPAVFNFKIHMKSFSGQSIFDAQDDWTDPSGKEDLGNVFDAATLTLPNQDISLRGQEEYSESLSYNPWRTLPEHEPYGSIAEARRVVYISSSHKRRDLNGQTLGEPRTPRPAKLYAKSNPPVLADGAPVANSLLPWPLAKIAPPVPDPTDPTKKDSLEIVRIAIHPGIGIARVGNSDESGNDMYIGPEIDTPAPMERGGTRDKSGAIKRQAARFRLYGYNAHGKVVKEITADDADTTIEWSVHLANKKGQWFRFDRAFDINNANSTEVSLRNIGAKTRAALAIDAGLQTISGIKTAGVMLDKGTYSQRQVTLGELRTDEKGRLLVLGGKGRSESISDFGMLVDYPGDSFNNSDTWFDDTSDGPVHAKIMINGKSMEADSSWVIVAPPNFAPDIIGFRTLYDLLVDTHIAAGILPIPEKISFTEHILPSLQRLDNLKWVNRGFEKRFGVDGKYNFTSSDFLERLSAKNTDAAGDNLRKDIFDQLHSPYAKKGEIAAWPLIYGDAFGIDNGMGGAAYNTADPNSSMPLSKLRYYYFEQWAEGNFESDWDPDAVPVQDLALIPLQDQPAMLDKAALHFCLADAFHPGCEVTWPMRVSTIYRAPFRIREASTPDVLYPKSYKMNTETISAPAGPLYGQTPGGLTRWMALPWQGDTSRCRAGYDADLLMDVPAFWPARVPNHVLTEDDYEIFIDTQKSLQERKDAYNRRATWWGLLPNAESTDQDDKEIYMQEMVNNFHKMYIMEARPGAVDLLDYPSTVYVGVNIV